MTNHHNLIKPHTKKGLWFPISPFSLYQIMSYHLTDNVSSIILGVMKIISSVLVSREEFVLNAAPMTGMSPNIGTESTAFPVLRSKIPPRTMVSPLSTKTVV